MSPSAEGKFDAVLFDLLTALLDSWALWNLVAASPKAGRKWRAAYLRRTYETGAYRPYETLVAEAAAEVGLSPTLAAQLAARYGELEPWPEVREVLGALRHGRQRSPSPASPSTSSSPPSAPDITSPTRGRTRWRSANWE